jgi:Nuclease-related domain
MGSGREARRVAGQHARQEAASARRKAFWASLVFGSRRYDETAARWARGAEGEEVVGGVLESLAEDGWLAIHDVALGRGNIDHIAIGPAGIFAIETKSHRGRIPIGRLDERMLKQAYAEKKVIESITQMDVQPLLVFSQAYLVGQVPARRSGVTVLPARMLEGYLSRRRPVISLEEAQALHRRLSFAVYQSA